MNDNNTSPPDSPPAHQDETDLLDSESGNPEGPPSRSRKQRKAGIVISWLLILAAVAITQIPQYRLDRQATQSGVTQDLTMQMMGRYVVGMKSVLGNTPAVDLSVPQINKALQNSDNSRKDLFFIPILMELTTREEALTMLEQIVAEPSNKDIAQDAPLFLQLYRQGSASLTQEQYRSIERYGWIGKLALSQDKPPSDPLRRSVISSALQTFVTAVVFIMGLLVAFAAGLILLTIAIVFSVKKRLRTRFSPLEDPGTSLLEAFAIFITGLIALPALARWLSPGYQLAASLFTFPVILIALAWPYFRGSKWKNIRTAIGWNRGQGFFREAASGILGYLAGLPLLAVAIIPVLLISRSTGSVPSHPIVNEISRDPIPMILILGLACVWAPIVEETFFRGLLFGYLRRRLHWSLAGISTGFLFAVIHPQGWIAVPVLAAIGFTLSAIREWRGSIIASMAAHSLNNGVVLLLAIFTLT
jgi:membrane protease YdiL (CAAX protease family)